MSFIAPVTTGNGEAWGLSAPLTPADFAGVAEIMQREARIHLVPTKTTLVHSRLSRRLRAHGLTRFADYLALVERDAAERAVMVEALTTNHTHFFREQHHFDHLQSVAFPQMRAKAQRETVRIWSAGCSSGEEVHTIAMCLLARDARWPEDNLKLLATDISPEVVAQAAAGRYPASSARQIPDAQLRRWTNATPDGFEIAPELRALVTARVLNLFEPWPIRRQFDAIFCRNVMIYFDDEAKAELEARLVDQLLPGGYLYIGHSERLIGAARLAVEPCGQTIYRKHGDVA